MPHRHLTCPVYSLALSLESLSQTEVGGTTDFPERSCEIHPPIGEMRKQKKMTIPFREGLFTEEANTFSLIGNRCEACGQEMIFTESTQMIFT